jgi:hypothetical protein
MSNLFEPRRFWCFFKKTILEKPGQLIGFTGFILLITFVFYSIFHLPAERWDGTQRISLFGGLTIGVTLLASFVFGHFSTNAGGCAYLTQPASQFEKWLCAILITGILFPLIFLGFFRIMDMSFVNYYHSLLDPSKPNYKQLYEYAHVFTFDNIISRNIYMLAGNFSGIMLVGALYFNKNAFIKTALVFCAVILLLFGLNYIIARLFFGTLEDTFPFMNVNISMAKNSSQGGQIFHAITSKSNGLFIKEIGMVELPTNAKNFFGTVVRYVLPPFWYLLAYIRLREKEF